MDGKNRGRTLAQEHGESLLGREQPVCIRDDLVEIGPDLLAQQGGPDRWIGPGGCAAGTRLACGDEPVNKFAAFVDQLLGAVESRLQVYVGRRQAAQFN